MMVRKLYLPVMNAYTAIMIRWFDRFPPAQESPFLKNVDFVESL